MPRNIPNQGSQRWRAIHVYDAALSQTYLDEVNCVAKHSKFRELHGKKVARFPFVVVFFVEKNKHCAISGSINWAEV